MHCEVDDDTYTQCVTHGQPLIDCGWRTNESSCPHCNANLQGDRIDRKYLTHENGCTGRTERFDRCFCLSYGKVTHFGRQIGVEVSGVYDGVLYWMCPDCGGRWHRGIDALHGAAEPYVNGDKHP